MLCSSCSMRALSLRSVKFLSRLLTALNLLPSMATTASVDRFICRHSTTNCRQTWRIAARHRVDNELSNATAYLQTHRRLMRAITR